MGRGQSQKPRDKNKQKLPQTPRRDIASDGLDIEFSQELADHDDLEAQQRSNAADRRAKERK
ncbi:YfhD family protein [Salinibacillus aidingensis]|uniref:YfhD family protein n=1 Tax=Salinibacillus aidingensis TaxID=237684 RepID=A0ABN1AN09_9BACI